MYDLLCKVSWEENVMTYTILVFYSHRMQHCLRIFAASPVGQVCIILLESELQRPRHVSRLRHGYFVRIHVRVMRL